MATLDRQCVDPCLCVVVEEHCNWNRLHGATVAPACPATLTSEEEPFQASFVQARFEEHVRMERLELPDLGLNAEY